MSPRIYSAYIINKSGSLVFQKSSSPDSGARDETNEHIRICSMLFTFDVLSRSVSPVSGPSHMVALESQRTMLRCMTTATGTKFFVFGDPAQTPMLEEFLTQMYRLYCDYVLKNPRHADINQPVHNTCEKFVAKVDELVAAFEAGSM